MILKAGGKEISTPGDLRNTIEDNIDRGEIEIELIRRGYVRVVSVPIVVEEL